MADDLVQHQVVSLTTNADGVPGSRQTTGSFSLNDVLSAIGTPVSRQKASIRAW
jgi:hypothetical protein